MDKSKIIKEYFRDNGFSIQYVADTLGVNRTLISQYINGKPFGKEMAKRWQHYFGISKLWLIADEEDIILYNIGIERK